MASIDQKFIPKLIKRLEKHLSRTSDFNENYISEARRITENICKVMLVKNGDLQAMDSFFQLSDLDKNSLYEAIDCENSEVKISIKVIQQLGNRAAHNIYDISTAEIIVCKKALSEVAFHFIPRIYSKGLTRKLKRARSKIYETGVVANKRYRSMVYLEAANALDESSDSFRDKLSVWINNILTGLIRDKYGKVPEELYFNKFQQKLDVYKCLERLESTEVKTWIPVLFKYSIDKEEPEHENNVKVNPSIIDAFFALANEIYKEPEPEIRPKENILTNMFQVIMITAVGIVTWLLLQTSDDTLIKYFNEQTFFLILIFLGAFMVIYLYELTYSFIPSTQRGLVREISSVLLIFSAIAVLVGFFKMLGQEDLLNNQNFSNISLITFIWILVLGITVYLNADLSVNKRTLIRAMGVTIIVATISLGMVINYSDKLW